MEDDVRLVRAIPGSHDACSLGFSNGRRGLADWHRLLADFEFSWPGLRRETVRVADGGAALLVDVHAYATAGVRQAANDITIAVPAAKALAVLDERDGCVCEFDLVNRAREPVRVALQYLGPAAQTQLPPEACRVIHADDVQAWYTAHGEPRAGMMTTLDRGGRERGIWQMV